MTGVEVPSSVTEIDISAFSRCTGLTSIEIPSSVTKIGNAAFSRCTGLTSVEIPSSVTEIGDNAFYGCTGLTSVRVGWETPLSNVSRGFDNVDKQSCTLYVPKGTYSNYWTTDFWSDFGNIVEYDAMGIDDMTIASDVKEQSRYSVDGQQLFTPTKGVNIVKYSDGSVKKVVQ